MSADTHRRFRPLPAYRLLLAAGCALFAATGPARAEGTATAAATATATAREVVATETPAKDAVRPARPTESGDLEARLAETERLGWRSPQQALKGVQALRAAPLTPFGQLRLGVVEVQALAMLYRLPEASAAVDALLPDVRKSGDGTLLARLLLNKALILLESLSDTEGIAHGEAALRLADASGDPELRVDALVLLADAHSRRPDFERAYAYLEQAEQIAQSAGRPGTEGMVAYAAARLAHAIDDRASAQAAFQRAGQAFRVDGADLAAADASRQEASLLIQAQKATEALPPLRQALLAYELLDDEFGIAATQDLLAEGLAAAGDVEGALAASRISIDIGRRNGSPVLLSQALLTRVLVLAKHRNGQGALPLLEEARPLLGKSPNLLDEIRYQSATAAAYAALGRYREANAALTVQLELRSKLEAQRLSRQLAAQRGRLESQRMRADLDRAQREAEEQRIELARAQRAARVQTLLTLLAVIGVAVAVYALVRSVRRGRRNVALARTDYLTGIQNRRRITELGQALLAHCRERGEPISVLMLDLDHFKSINDDHGHQAGDRALQSVSAELKRHLRAGDELGRYGGEEFAVVLPATALDRAEAIGERLRAAIAALATADVGLDRPLTVSIGIAGGDRPASDFNTLLQQADEALYAAKQAGRNRVQRHDTLPPPSAHASTVARTPHAPTTPALTLVQPHRQAE